MDFTIKGIHRIGLWLLLIVLTVSILLFPTRLTLEYYPIQSTRIFDNFPLFAALFCIWLLVLLLLLFSRRGEGDSDWEKLALVCVFSAVFLGFWVIVTHNGLYGEGIYNAAHVKYLNEVGRIPVGHGALGYFDFPGLHLIGSSVSLVTGLDPIKASVVIVFSQAIGLAALLYALFRRLLNSAYAAPLAVLLVIAGNISLAKLNFFHPRYLGLILLVTFLVLLFRHKGEVFGTTQDKLLMIILAAAAMMTHFITSFLLFFIMLCIYVVQKLDRTNMEKAPPLIIFLVLPLAWAMYWAIITFQGLVGTFPKVLADLAETEGVLWFFTMMQQANVGERLPLWANISRLFWWVLIYGFGSILGLWNLFRLKKLSPTQKRATGVLLGIMVITAVSTLASLGGARFDTYILYGAFAAVPILLWFLLSLRNHIRRYALVCLVILFFVLSFPTFLSHNSMIEFGYYYPYEHAAGKFLESSSTEDKELHLFGGEWVNHLAKYYVPNAIFHTVHTVLYMKDEAGLWVQIEKLGTGFKVRSGSPESEAVFIWSKRLMLTYQHFFGVTSEHPNWQKLKDRVAYHNKIYDNGDAQIFSAR